MYISDAEDLGRWKGQLGPWHTFYRFVTRDNGHVAK